MEIQILENRTVRIANNNFGVIGENKAEVLEFTFPEEYQLNNKFIEFETSDGKFVDTIVDNQYPITNAITKYEELRAQIVIKDLNDNMVFKSRIFTMKFKESINATEQLDEEKKLLIDELLVEVETLQEDVENLETDNAQNKTDISTLKTDNETNKTNISTMQERISTIQEEQTTQNTNISANTTKNAEQDSLIQKLKDNMINLTTEEDTSLYITDAGTPPAKLTIRGNHRQEVKNSINELHLIDTPETALGNGLSYKIEDETLILNGSVSSAYGLVITTQSNIVDLIKSGEEWVLSVYGENMPDVNTFIRIATTSNANALQAVLTSSSLEDDSSATFTENSTAIRIMLAANAVYNNSKIKMKLEPGSTKTDYDKYCKMPSIETPSEISTVKDEVNVVVSNKNMFNVPSSNLYGVEITLQEDGSYLINGTSTASWAFRVGEPVWLGAGDYVLSMEASSPLYQGGVGIQGSNNFKYELWDTSNKSIHLTEDKKVQCYFAFNINATYDNVVVKIQLEKSNTKTDWVKHEEIKKTLDIQQEMLKGDYFDLENDKEVCGFKKKIFTGTETISATVNGNSFSYIASDILADTNTIKIPKIYSNCYSACSWQDRNTNNKPNTVSAYNITIGFDKGNFATVEEFKAELAKRYSEGNPVYVIYPLAENEELDLTETQKQQLAQLDNLDLYRGINNIYTEEGIALMQLDYSADTKMYIDNLVTQNTAESEG